MRYATFAIGGGAIFAVGTLTGIKRLVAGLADREMTQPLFAGTMMALFLGAYVADALGIYAVFGAFVIGAALPKGRFVEGLKSRLEPVTVGLFLPFFFVFSGLNTKIGLLDTPALWGICALVCAAAILGKFGGCALAARAAGEPWREASAIGVLMNARGLMELIILNIGLQKGVITPTLFTLMTIMAIVTTLMASPLFRLLHPERRGAAIEAVPAA